MNIGKDFFLSKNRPLGRFFLVVAMSVCLSPFHVIFFEASHWPSGHMIRSRPLIGRPFPAKNICWKLFWWSWRSCSRRCPRWDQTRPRGPGVHSASLHQYTVHHCISTPCITASVHRASIHPPAVTFEPLMGFWCPSGFRKFLITMT